MLVHMVRIMNRSMHLLGGVIFWIVALLGYFWSSNRSLQWADSIWITTSFLMAIIGAEIADFDLELGRYFTHRNFFTHSILLPGLLALPLIFVDEPSTNMIPVFSMFLVGASSHLLLDLSPKTWRGSANIHFPWKNREGYKQMGGRKSFLWLFVNALLSLILAIILLLFYNQLLN